MYVYCLNNPVVCADTNGNYTYYVVNGVETKEVGVDDNGFVTYETTINYTYVTMNAYVLFSPEVRLDGTVTYQYTVDNRGAISYDSRKNEGGELGDKAISTALAKEMYSTATNQVNGALSGRTIDGIAKELRRHTQFAFLGEKIGVADIGGLDKNKPDYDYNARMFENPWKALSVIFEMLFK